MRAFIAVDLADNVRRQLAEVISCLRRSNIRASWVRTENLHVTMKFLGDIDDDLVPDLCRKLDRVAEQENRFRVKLKGSGFFPQRGRPRILYAATNQQQRFEKLVEGMDSALVPLGFNPEQNFVPHITLARIKGARHLQQLYNELEQVTIQSTFSVIGLSLYRSILQSSGVRYERLHRSLFRQ